MSWSLENIPYVESLQKLHSHVSLKRRLQSDLGSDRKQGGGFFLSLFDNPPSPVRFYYKI